MKVIAGIIFNYRLSLDHIHDVSIGLLQLTLIVIVNIAKDSDGIFT